MPPALDRTRWLNEYVELLKEYKKDKAKMGA